MLKQGLFQNFAQEGAKTKQAAKLISSGDIHPPCKLAFPILIWDCPFPSPPTLGVNVPPGPLK